MKKFELVDSLKDSLDTDFADLSLDYGELAIDGLFDNDILKDIPIFKTIVALAKTGINIRDRHLLKETLIFIKSVNEGNISEENRNKFLKRYNNDKKTKEELERVIIIIDSHIDSKQTSRLGHFFDAYINENINWSKFIELSQANQRIFEEDIKFLMDIKNQYEIMDDYKGLRLAGIGLVQQKSMTVDGASLNFFEREYELTDFGKMFLQYM